MMRWLPLMVLLVLTLGRPAPADEPASPAPPLTLREAVKSRQVRALGTRPTSYRRVHLEVENRTQTPLALDLCASFLRPRRRGSCQRLGLGPVVTPSPQPKPPGGGLYPGMVVLWLEPGQKTSIELNTCCLDAGRSAPSTQEFVVATVALPPVREKVLRWWADHPTASQSAVNAAIWQFRDTVIVGSGRRAPGPSPVYTAPKGAFAAAHGGTFYRLDDGELFSRDAEGIERFLGTEIHQVLPVEGAVYAVALGEDHLPDLWRLALTGDERWAFVMDLDAGERILDVVPAGNGNLVLVQDGGVGFWNKATGTRTRSVTTTQPRYLSTRRSGRHRLTVTRRRPPKAPTYRGGSSSDGKAPVFELWSLDLETGKADLQKQYWNVRSMRAGPAGVYGISHRGRLRRLLHTSFKDLGPSGETWRRILAVGKQVVWMTTSSSKLAALDARSGRLRKVFDLDPVDFQSFQVDPKTDAFVFSLSPPDPQAWAWNRVDPETLEVETVYPRPASGISLSPDG